MKIHDIDNESLESIKAGWNSRNDHWFDKNIDERFVDFLKSINQNPELVTLHHCSGHIKGERQYSEYCMSSYMVISAQGESAIRLGKMVEFLVANKLHGVTMLESPSEDYELKRIGWEIFTTDSVVCPWHTLGPVAVYETVPTTVLNLYHYPEQDPDGTKTVELWVDLFKQFELI